MTIQTPTPGRAPFEQAQVRPNVPFFADYRRGVANAISGQAPVFVRASSATVTAANGGTFAVGLNRPALSHVGNAVAYVQTGTLKYAYPVRPTAPLQVAWDGISTVGLGVLWRIGGAGSSSAYLELRRIESGFRATYADGSGNLSTAELYGLPVASRVYVVAQLVPSGSNVQVRLAATDLSLQWYTSGLGTARAFVAAWSAPEIHVGSLAGASAMSSNTYRVFAQAGAANVDDLAWGWDAGVNVLPELLGLVDGTNVTLEYGAAGNRFFVDQGAHISIESTTATHRAVAPGGLVAPVIYLEAV